MKTYVKLFREGDRFAIETNADTEDDFHHAFCEELNAVIRAPAAETDTAFQLLGWVGYYAEIVCKLRGYKSEATVRRIIQAGQLSLKDEDRVTPAPASSGEVAAAQ